MADVKESDPLTWFPGAPSTSTSSAPASKAAPASESTVKESDPLTWFPGKTATATQQPPQGQLPNVSEYGDLGNAWWNTQANAPPGQSSPALDRITEAASQGFSASPVLTPEAKAAADAENQKTVLGRYVVAPLVAASEFPFRVANALGAGGTQAIYEAGNALDPRLGRDLVMLSQVAPVAAAETAPVRAAMQPQAAPEVNALSPRFAGEYSGEAGPGTSLQRITGAIQKADEVPAGSIPTAAERTATREAAPEAGQGAQPGAEAPQPAGAQATPSTQSGLSPEQARAYGSTADKQWLYSSQQPGVTDATEYYPGDTPTLAEREQTTLAARDQKTQRNISPAADQAEREFLFDRSEQRKGIFQATAGSDATQDAAITEADTNISNGLAQAFRAGGRVDPQGIVDAISAESQTSGGKLPPVKAAMRDVSAALQKDDGTGMETDPQAVYQVRRVINYLQSKEGKVANPGYGSADVQAALTRVKGAIDEAIEPAAPGFRQAIADYSNAQRAIEAREFLQAEEPKLYDSRGYMNYGKFHTFMQRVITMRDPRMPPNAAQSLTDEQMATLKGLHDSLKRSASAEDLAKARGSDTTPILMDIARQAVSGVGGDIGAAVIGGLSHGPAGMIIGPMVKRGVGEFLSARGQAKAATRMQNLLRPDPAQYPTTPNPLSPP